MKKQNATGSKSQTEARDGQRVPPVWAEPAGETVAHACNRDAESCCIDGATPSNTAPAKYTTHENITPLRCSIDSLYISYKGEINTNIESLLNELKGKAQHPNTAISSEAVWEISEHRFEVKPKGAGKFSFVLDDNWFNIQISSSKAVNMPMAYVQVKSELLTFHPLQEILAHLYIVVSSLGTLHTQASISRLDLCMDFICQDGFDIESIDAQQWRSRATQRDKYHQNKRVTGWRIGKGLVVARLYNKTLEILMSKKDYLKPLWTESGWDSQQDVWRIEFQFRRQFLSNVEVSKPTQIHTASNSLWKYATEVWLQLVEVDSNDSNASRWPTHPAWLEVSNAYDIKDCKSLHRVKKQRLPHDQFLFMNGISAFSSFMAREGISDFDEALTEFFRQAEEYHEVINQLPMEDYIRMKAVEKTKRYNTILKE